MGEQKIILNFNKLQAVASLPLICTKPQAAMRLDAIRERIEIYLANKEEKCKKTNEREMNIAVWDGGQKVAVFDCHVTRFCFWVV